MRILFALVTVFILGEGGVFAAVCLCAKRKFPPENADALVVLGARVHPDGTLSDALRYRLETAYDCWREGRARVFVLCGAQGADETETEARAMKRCLLSRGVPESALIEEDQSFNTLQNLQNAREKMESRGMRTAIIVTSDYHLTRALKMAKRLNMDVCGAKAPSVKKLKFWLIGRIRETLSWQYWFVRGIRGKTEKNA